MIVACVTALTLALAVSSAIGAPSASWKSAAFVFAGSGQYSYRYAPGRGGKSQKVTMTWTIEWRLKPNEGHAKTVSEKITVGRPMSTRIPQTAAAATSRSCLMFSRR